MATKATSYKPEGMHTATPHLIIKGASKAIEFYKKAFGAEELFSMPGPGGSVMHAEIKIGDSVIYLADEAPDWGCVGPQTLKGSSVTIHLYVPDCDAAYDRAVKAGATASMPLQDMFWGDRYGKITDPFGHVWSLATHKEDLSPDEIGQRMAAAFGGGKCSA